ARRGNMKTLGPVRPTPAGKLLGPGIGSPGQDPEEAALAMAFSTVEPDLRPHPLTYSQPDGSSAVPPSLVNEPRALGPSTSTPPRHDRAAAVADSARMPEAAFRTALEAFKAVL